MACQPGTWSTFGLPTGRLKIRFFFQLLVTPVKQISSVATLSRAWKTGFGFPEVQEKLSLLLGG